MTNDDDPTDLYPLQRAFDETTRDMPRLMLERLLNEKLAGIPEARRTPFVKALADHIFNHLDQPFEWDDGGPDFEIDLTLTEADSARYHELIDELGVQMPEMIGKMSDETSDAILDSRHKRWPAEDRGQRRDERGFRKRLDQRWGRAFSALRKLLTMCREVIRRNVPP